MEKYATCEHCNKEVAVINKEDYAEVSYIIKNLKASPDNEYIIEEGPKYSRDSDDAWENAEKDGDKLEKKHEKYYERLGIPLLMGGNVGLKDKNYYYGIAYIKYYPQFDDLDSIICEGEHKCPRCKKDAVFDIKDTNLKKYDEKIATKYVEEIKSKFVRESIINDNLNKTDQIDLKEYLGLLINIGKDIYFLEEKMKKIIRSRNECERSMHSKEYELSKDKKNEMIENHRKMLEKNVETAKKKYEKEIKVDEKELDKICERKGLIKPKEITEPLKPKKPNLKKIQPEDLIKPNEPTLEKSKFYNRKAVEKRNNELIKKYKKDLKKYEETLKQNEKNEKSCMKYEENLKKYNVELQNYNLEKEQYDKDIEIYQKKRNVILQEREEKKITRKKAKELANTIREYEDNLKQYNNEVNKKQGDKVVLIAEDNLYKECYIDKIFYDSEIQDIVKNLEEEYNCLNEILSVGIIYPKYNELVAWTTMYEYFATGRVTELKGTDGAYNLYESESRANTIIGQLDIVISQLEQIKNNQYMLYQIMTDINNNLSAISDQMNHVTNALNKIEVNTADVNILLGEINNNSKVSAYYNAKTAKYSEIIANRTQALVFLKAMFG